jgi:hypothetical protein
MKRMSLVGLAMAAKTLLNGPTTAGLPRNPWLGVPPWIHAEALAVEYPSPNDLSRKAQRKMNPVASRSTASDRRPAELVTNADSETAGFGRRV